uniref:phosphoenolpyruvate carboxykinase (GTP) n=1 Tax=Romanomermis culicivorax TaxID=13658 RepID=A0A915I9X5_ROMCU
MTVFSKIYRESRNSSIEIEFSSLAKIKVTFSLIRLERVINHWPCNPEKVIIAQRPKQREIWSFGSNYGGNSLLGKKCFALRIAMNIARDEGWLAEHMLFIPMTNWMGEPWQIGKPGQAAHPNSRFTTPASQCPIIHPRWEDPAGVPIDAIIFGGRRPEGVPLVFESFDWAHGVFVGAGVKSEATAAAEYKGKTIMHDPMAMRPFMGYNFGKYLEHCLDRAPHKVPKIFHVNWFRRDKDNKFLWPGYGENIRALEWILKRVDGQDVGVKSPIGILPKKGSINMDGLEPPVNWDELFSLPKDYWVEDARESRSFFEEQVGSDLPAVIREHLDKQEERIKNM